MTTWCPNCGDSHECTAELAREDDKTRIQLATIEANRDIRIAELGAQAAKVDAAAAVDIAEAEAAIDTAEAEGRAEGMETAIDDLSGAGAVPDGAGQDGADASAVPEFPVIEDEAAAETTPPPPDAPPPPRKPGRTGWWDNYA